MVRVHSGLPYLLAAPVVLPTVRCGGPEGPGILRHIVQQGRGRVVIGRDHESSPWFPTAIEYYFQIIDLSVCLPIITALQPEMNSLRTAQHVR